MCTAEEGHLPNVSPARSRTAVLDETCAEAADLARGAAEEMAGQGNVGEHVGVVADDERVVTHLFAALDKAYAGWRWAVTVTRASRSRTVTVDEVVLLPGPDSLLAPDWVPWSERVRPGDLGVGDLMPTSSDDERLVPATMLEGDDGVLDWDDSAAWAEGRELAESLGLSLHGASPAEDLSTGEAGLADELGPPEASAPDVSAPDVSAPEVSVPGVSVPGVSAPEVSVPEATAGRRTRVLSAIGRDMTAIRWYSSEHGPSTPLARAAPGPCLTCGFLIPLAGPLGRVFGVCANEYAPDDGRVVSLDHGCGAHSEASPSGGSSNAITPVIDEVGYDLVDMPGVALADTVFESLDHELES